MNTYLYLRNWFQYILHKNEINIWLVNNFNWHFVHVHDAKIYTKAQNYGDVLIIIARTPGNRHSHTLKLIQNALCSLDDWTANTTFMHFTFTSTRDNVKWYLVRLDEIEFVSAYYTQCNWPHGPLTAKDDNILHCLY